MVMRSHSLNFSVPTKFTLLTNLIYESAKHLHDMNEGIPGDFKEKYTAVLDAGSLEHIFNFPVAIKNRMDMVNVSGHYLAITPANNFCGHGFYQFSPELYFSVLTRENRV